MLEGVSGGDCFAGWRDRPGGLACVAAICDNLLVRGLRILPIFTNGFVLEKSQKMLAVGD